MLDSGFSSSFSPSASSFFTGSKSKEKEILLPGDKSRKREEKNKKIKMKKM
jgi:hypothetical protein